MTTRTYTPEERDRSGPVNLIDLEADAQARSEAPSIGFYGTPATHSAPIKARAVGATPSHGGNPKDAIGASKAPLSTLEAQVVHEIALGMFEGECKYWRHNYIASRVRAMVYVDAHDRHMSAWKSGQDIDPDSGLSHLVKAMACLHIIRAAEIHGSLIDDRPPANPDPDWMRKLDAKALEIVQRLLKFERGAFTEANRAEWPAMCERLANGPIAKVAAAYAAQPPARYVRVEPTVPVNAHGTAVPVNAHGTAVYQWVMLHVPPEPGTAVEVRLYSETATPQWEPDVFVSVDDVGDWEFASGSWYRPSDPDAFCISAVRVRA
jgi:hypothetical protein